MSPPQPVDLSFEFPFFGRRLTGLVVSTGGALLAGDPSAPLAVPSYVGPFLTPLEPGGEDLVMFHDFGERLYPFVEYFLYYTTNFGKWGGCCFRKKGVPRWWKVETSSFPVRPKWLVSPFAGA